jgi:uncharacterized protein YcfL
MKNLITNIVVLFLVSACGAAKTVYSETKQQVCLDSCEIKISKHNYQGLSKCKSECRSKFRDNVK